MLRRCLVPALLALLAGTGCTGDEQVAGPPQGPGHGGAAPDGDHACVEAAPERTLTGSSSTTLAQVVTTSGASDALAAGPFADLPPEHAVTACFYNDGRTYSSLLVDQGGRVADNPAAPTRPVTPAG